MPGCLVVIHSGYAALTCMAAWLHGCMEGTIGHGVQHGAVAARQWPPYAAAAMGSAACLITVRIRRQVYSVKAVRGDVYYILVLCTAVTALQCQTSV